MSRMRNRGDAFASRSDLGSTLTSTVRSLTLKTTRAYYYIEWLYHINRVALQHALLPAHHKRELTYSLPYPLRNT
jgi:hypothetical protein